MLMPWTHRSYSVSYSWNQISNNKIQAEQFYVRFYSGLGLNNTIHTHRLLYTSRIAHISWFFYNNKLLFTTPESSKVFSLVGILYNFIYYADLTNNIGKWKEQNCVDILLQSSNFPQKQKHRNTITVHTRIKIEWNWSK